MKAFKMFSLMSLVFVSQNLFAEAKKYLIPHIMPDATSTQYQWENRKLGMARANADVDYAIKLGERNLAWLKHMNSFRPDGKKIQLTRPGDLKGIPIENAKSYSPLTIKESYDTTYRDMPGDMAKILYSNTSFSDDVPIVEVDYIIWANKVDKNYQTATRWKLMEPYLPVLEKRRADDLRGFYFLSKKTANVESVLRSYASQTAESQQNIINWLQQMCRNAYGLNAGCEAAVLKASQAGTLYEFYLKVLPKSQDIWDSNFALENPRAEISWSSKAPTVMNVPFRDPLNDVIKNFLKLNIEDEFKWTNWNMRINIVPQAPIHVEFQPGVTPHVNGAGGDTITMDANTPLTEWDVQWTIRHEFGHVLGFVDCYLEFYDPSEKAIVTYQLDIDHLMCARSGRMQKTIYDTLKQYYYK